MRFLYPEFLFALSLLAIPIIIHLFNFRRYKKIYFPNVRLLTQIQQESSSRNKLKHLLLLSARMLAISALIFAFAQPYFPSDDNEVRAGKNSVSIYIDNSYSMSNVGSEGELLAQAINKLEEIVHSYRETDEFNIITNNISIGQRQFQSKDRFLESIPSIQPGGNSRDISSVIRYQSQLLSAQEAENKTAFVISDFQKSITDLSTLGIDTNIQIILVPLKSSSNNNLYIDSAWYENPVFQLNQISELKVRVRNFGNEKAENIPVRYVINNKQKALGNITINAGEREVISLPHTLDEAGWNKGIVSITDYPITFDDDYYLSFQVKDQVNILLVSQGQSNNYIQSVYNTNPIFKIEHSPSGNIDYSSLSRYDFIIFDGLSTFPSGLAEEIKNYVANGGNTLVIPATEGNVNTSSYNSLFAGLNSVSLNNFEKQQVSVNNINLEHPIFRNVFESVVQNVNLPGLQKYYSLRPTSTSRTTSLLSLAAGDIFLSHTVNGSGNFYVMASPLNMEYSNFPRHALFVPVMYQMATYNSSSANIANFIGQQELIELVSTGENSRNQLVTLKKDNFEIIPEQRFLNNRINLSFPEQLPEAGFYQVDFREQNRDNNQVLAFNYNRKESELDFYSAAELAQLSDNKNITVLKNTNRNLSVELASFTYGNNFWKLFIILSLLFIIAEVIILKFWRT